MPRVYRQAMVRLHGARNATDVESSCECASHDAFPQEERLRTERLQPQGPSKTPSAPPTAARASSNPFGNRATEEDHRLSWFVTIPLKHGSQRSSHLWRSDVKSVPCFLGEWPRSAKIHEVRPWGVSVKLHLNTSKLSRVGIAPFVNPSLNYLTSGVGPRPCCGLPRPGPLGPNGTRRPE